MEFVAFEKGIEVNGQTVNAVVDGFRAFSGMASDYLAGVGIGEKGPDGLVHLQPDGWYSQEAWLEAFRRISETVGQSVLFQIGQAIPRNAQFPPFVKDAHSAVQAIDVAYHMNHRKAGQVMFDPEKGTMLEGIGHYGYERSADGKTIISVCRNPYPCQFDKGIVTAMARRFEAKAVVQHDDKAPCRHKGADACTYLVHLP